MPEYWDIYDERKRPTGRRMVRNDWHMKPGEFHLSVIGAVQDLRGRYLITQRKLDKEWGAGWWEFPGGGVRAGETSEEAMRREFAEETGVDISGAEGGLVFYYTRINPDEGNNYFMDVYRYTLDFSESDVRVQESEVEGFALATLGEIEDIAARGEFLHYNSIKQIFGR